jgi:hypothetical protein
MEYELKDYVVRIVPKVITVDDEEKGKVKKPVYCRPSKPSEAAQKAGFKASKFYHLEIFDRGKSGRKMGGDTKPYTMVVFENSERLLFDAISEIEADKDEYTVMENNLVKVLNKESLPGLLRKRPAPQYFATRIDKNGAEVKLMQSVRQPNGSYLEEPVILESVTYFLFENELNQDADEIKYANALKRTQMWRVKATADEAPVETPDEEEEEEETEES